MAQWLTVGPKRMTAPGIAHGCLELSAV